MWDSKRKRFKPSKGGRPTRRVRLAESIDLRVPNELLDLGEDLAHQLYWERSKMLVEAIRLGLKKVAEIHGLDYDRLEKVTYKDRAKPE